MTSLDTHMYKKLLDNLSSAVIWVDHNLKIKYVNSSAETLFEVSGRQVENESLSAMRLYDDNPIVYLAKIALRGAIFTQREAQLQLKSGSSLTVDFAVTPVSDTNPTSLIIELQSIDRLLKISREENLLAAQETSRTLIRGLAHEVKNPLGGIRGAAQLLNKLHDDVADYTQVIIDETDRLRNLVDNMLGPNTQINKSACNIHEVLERVQQLICAETDDAISISRDYDPSIPDFLGDKEQLIQATLNIARNAMQAILESAVEDPLIRFQTRIIRQFTIGDIRHKLVCIVKIIDNGPGIPEHLLDKLFFPMVSGRATGTGLGLSISQSIVQRHNGLIECSNDTGSACFTLYLPLEY